ncbi:MAG TPA: glutaredoxin family protein [Mycobacteriales bacterium]|nr:glutaredoxin family protein [Mycobacteriales bacterium]
MTDAVRVEVIVSPDCHLCEDACSVVAEVCTDLGVGWVRTSIADLDPDTQVKWREYTPVIVVDGAVHDVFRVTPDRLRAALT